MVRRKATCIVDGCRRKGYLALGTGLTFHMLPNGKRRAKWIEAMRLDSDVSPSSYVCGLHFKDSDYATAARTKLVPRVVPSILPEDIKVVDSPNCAVESSSKTGLATTSKIVACPEQFKTNNFNDTFKDQKTMQVGTMPIVFCRICLATDVKMFHFKNFNLGQIYQNITGAPVSAENSSMLQRVCWECAERLTAAGTLRHKALHTDALLRDLLRTKNHINKSDIESLKKIHPSITLAPIRLPHIDQSKQSVQKNIDIEILMNKLVESESKERDSEMRDTDAPIKTEIDDDTDIHEDNHFNDDLMSKKLHTDEIRNTEIKIDNNDAAPSEVYKDNNKTFEIPIVNSYNDKILNIKKESSVENDVDIGKVPSQGDMLEENMPNKNIVGAAEAPIKSSTDRPPIKYLNQRIDERTKQQIIRLKQDGMPIKQMSRYLGVSRNTIRLWWRRWTNEHTLNSHIAIGRKRSTTAEEDQSLIDRVKSEHSVHTPSLAQEFGISTRTARKRLREAGFKVKQRKAVEAPVRTGGRHRVDDDTKRQIIAMKRDGVCVTDIANKLQVTRTSVYFWWRRWCQSSHGSDEIPNNGRTSAEQDQNSTEHVHDETSVHTPLVISSQKTVWEKD